MLFYFLIVIIISISNKINSYYDIFYPFFFSNLSIYSFIKEIGDPKNFGAPSDCFSDIMVETTLIIESALKDNNNRDKKISYNYIILFQHVYYDFMNLLIHFFRCKFKNF